MKDPVIVSEPKTTLAGLRRSNHGNPAMRPRKNSRFQWLGLALLLTACPASSDEVRPPSDQMFFPAGVAIDPAESVLFVANANSELRYDTGTVIVADLQRVEDLLAGWLADGQIPADPAGCDNCCEVDPDEPTVLVCNERAVMRDGAIVRMGNFASTVAVQELADGNLRLFLPVRGDPSITWVDYDVGAGTLSCGGTGTSPLCDGEHRLDSVVTVESSLFSEPWGVHVDSGNEYVMVTHLTEPVVTLLDAPASGAAPTITDVAGGLFSQNPESGVRGATGVAGRLPGTPGDLVYVTSRAEARVQTLTVYRRAGRVGMVAGDFFFLDQVGPSDDSRGIAFSEDGNTGFVVNRDPPTLQLLDTRIDATGVPTNRVFGAIEICRDASILTVSAARAYVSCFADSRIWALDTDRQTLLAVIDVGRGANSTAVSPSRGRLYVSNFLEDTISVIDITPGSFTENRVVMQLGRERQSGGE